MLQDKFIVQTKLTPPRLPRHALRRQRLTARLREALDHRVTIVQANTGYGKSTALTTLVDTGVPTVWYQPTDEDSDPQLLLLHLTHGFHAALPELSTAPLALLEQGEQQRSAEMVVDRLVSALNEALDGALVLILDDFHLLHDAAPVLRLVDRFIGRAPHDLHVILSTRYPPELPSLLRWRVRGEVLEVGQDELAFAPPEIGRLFRERFNLELAPSDVELIHRRTEGWPIALPLIWQRLERSGQPNIEEALGEISGSGGDLFAYLAQEVLARQRSDIRDFLRVTAVLRQMTAESCDRLRAASDSGLILRHLLDQGLFVVDLGGGHCRYHHLFRKMMLHQLERSEAMRNHRRAAALWQAQGQEEEAIFHLLEAATLAPNPEQSVDVCEAAAQILRRRGRALVRAGRLDTLSAWLSSFPPDILANHPPLLTYMGDLARLHSRFDEALRWYEQAETRARAREEWPAVGQALRGKARVYLDTVNPAAADELLQEALRLTDGQADRESRARLLDLMAENMLNQGRFKDTERYQEEARRLRQEGPGEAALPIRLLLRTGRLHDAHDSLRQQVEAEREEPIRRPRAHRETLLLLSLIHAFRGERDAAYRCAVEGTARGQELESEFITAVGHMRQGHAWLLGKTEADAAEARRCFYRAIRLSESIGVPRLRIEADWGLCQAYGFYGNLSEAEQAARQAIEIARAHGDEWIEGNIRLAMGSALVRAGETGRAAEWLNQAGAIFHETGDTYGAALVHLWHCLLWQQRKDHARLKRDVSALLRSVQRHRYEFLFERRALLGPPEPRALIPLLIFARDHECERAIAERLLTHLGLARLDYHPGYQLRVQTLGAFRVWRGETEIASGDWRRQKARQLFLLLLTYRDTLLEREQIIDMLWPELDPEGGVRDFKIAFTTLCKVLEPDRRRKNPYAYVSRDGSRYGLRMDADLRLDAAEFEAAVTRGDEAHAAGDVPTARGAWEEALALYQGDFLQEYPYEEWCSETRERLNARFLSTADRLAHLLAHQAKWPETIRVAHQLLEHDDCWENAYRLLMEAHAARGNRTQALRVYERCRRKLEQELNVAPGEATQKAYIAIRTEESLIGPT